jgi:hypothetical protein
MRRTALLAAAVALIGTPAAAEGYLGARYGGGDIDFLGGADLEVWQAEGAVGWNSGSGWGGQFGASFGNVEFDSGGDGDAWTADGHLYWQNGSWRFGGVVATTQLDFDSSTSLDDWVYGLETMFETGANSNIFASVTVGEAEFLADADTWNVDAGANFYAGPNTRFGGFVGFGNLDFGGGDSDSLSAGLNTEFQPWSAPVSITLGWNYFDADDAGIDATSWNVGARWNFGGGTLQERNNAVPFTIQTGLLDRFYGTW